MPDGLVSSKIALDGWTGHSHGAGSGHSHGTGRQQQAPSHQQSPVLQSHTNTTLTQHQQRSVITSSPQPPEPPGHHDGKHSLLQFAMLHFRQSPEKWVHHFSLVPIACLKCKVQNIQNYFFRMGVKLGLCPYKYNTDLGCLRTRCWREYSHLECKRRMEKIIQLEAK